MKKFLLCFIALFILIGCGGRPTANLAQTLPNTDSVTIIFTDTPRQSAHSFSGASSIAGVFFSYMDKDGLPRYIKYPGLYDTVTIPVLDGYLEVAHQYQGLQYNYFLLKGGDTVEFTYNEKYQPYATSKVYPELTAAYNFPYTVEGFTTEKWLQVNDALRVEFDIERRKKFLELADNYVPNYEKTFNEAIAAGLLDSVYRDYYTYKLDMLKIPGEDYNSRVIGLASGDHSKYISIDLEFLPNVGRYAYKNNFDVISKDSTITSPLRKQMLFGSMRWFISNPQPAPTQKEVDNITSKFIEITGDSNAVSRVLSLVNYIGHTGNPSELSLIDLSGEPTTLNRVLEGLRGKVVYIDFWASWCAPCVGAFPAALDVRRHYKGQEVVFLYLSSDRDRDKWTEAVEKYELDDMGVNYCYASGSSKFIADLDIDRIPRYILYDKAGNLAETNAVQVNKKGVYDLLDKYLK